MFSTPWYVKYNMSTEIKFAPKGHKMDRKETPKDEDDAWESLGEVVARAIAKMFRKEAA